MFTSPIHQTRQSEPAIGDYTLRGSNNYTKLAQVGFVFLLARILFARFDLLARQRFGAL